ncbi:MAG: TetR/AcrR family transcriptional regulator [Marmoricola sp.]
MRSDAMWLQMALAADAEAATAPTPDEDEEIVEEDWAEEAGVPAKGDAAERLLRRFLALCENPRTRERMLNLVKGAVAHEGSGRRFYAVFNSLVLSPVMRLGGLKNNALRGELVGSQLVGLAMMRYVIKVEPICSVDREVVVEMMAPAIRAALRGE